MARPVRDGASQIPPIGFEQFYMASFRLVVGRVFLIVGDWHLAEDLAQDAMLEMMDQWTNRRARPVGANIAWTVGIAVNLARRHRRRLAVHAKVLARWINGQRSTVGSVDVEVVARAEAYRRVAALPERLRAVAVLWALADMTDEEIATTLGIASSTVRTYFQRIRKHLGDETGIRDNSPTGARKGQS